MQPNLIAPKYTISSFALALLTLFYLILPAFAVAQTTYSVTDLGTLGGPFGVAHGIDASGQVNGFALRSDGLQHAFLRPRGATTNLDLGTLGGLNSDSSFRFSETQVAGGAEINIPDPYGFGGLTGDGLIVRAYLWQNGAMTDLGTLGGNNSYANGINTRGQVSGWAAIADLDQPCKNLGFSVQQAPPVLWENGKIQPLPMLPGDLNGFVLSVNNGGIAVGFSAPSHCSPVIHAALWQNGTVTPLGSLGGMSNNWALNSNDLGQVVGFSDVTGDTTNHAFLWQDGLMTDLGTLSGDFSSFAPVINNKGQVVGASCDQNGNCRAFLWQNGDMTDLNTLIPADSPLYLLQALDINSLGQIVGCAFQFSSGEVHAFLLDPVIGASGAVPRLAAPGEGPRNLLPDDLRKKLLDSVIPGAGRFKVRIVARAN
jgi:probable HAF family extracellular repeat protein